MKFKLYDWFMRAMDTYEEKNLEWRMGAREYAQALRKIDPRMASELDAAIDRQEQELEARPTAGN
jgi:hypothetical protein